MQKIAIDFGFGKTKVRTAEGCFSFHSAVAYTGIYQAEIDAVDQHNYEGVTYQVGDSAVNNALTTRDYTWLEKFSPLLFFKALQLANFDLAQPIHLATGLSLLNWEQKEKFADRLSDFIVDKTRVNDVKINLTPQGKGVYLDCLQQMPELAKKLVLVVDIGTNTLDVIPFESGRPIVREAWANSTGFNLIIQNAQSLIKKQFGVMLNEAQTMRIVEAGTINIGGESRDLSVHLQHEMRVYFDILLNQLLSKNADLYRRADLIIFAGGGAVVAQQYLTQNNFYFVDQAQYSNVNGYFSLLKE